MGREWIEIGIFLVALGKIIRSPSLGREWIEISKKKSPLYAIFVSLLGEGVD